MTLEKPKSVADVLEAAADLIEPDGAWTQGEYVGINGNCWCALGAIKRVGNYVGDINPASMQLLLVISGRFVHEWNDAPERTQREVVEALRSAASLSRQNEEEANG